MRGTCSAGASPAAHFVDAMSEPAPASSLHDLTVQRFGFVLLQNFSLVCLSAAIDPLRLANMVVGRRVYDYALLGVDAPQVTSSAGVRVLADADIAGAADFDAVFVVGPNPIPRSPVAGLGDWLHQCSHRGVALGGLDTGSYFLARAGLLDGYRCTIHWEDQDLLLERFPKVTVTSRLYEIDRDRYTCSGGIASLDLMMQLLGRAPGSRELVARVLELLVAEARHQQRQRTSLRQYIGPAHGKLDEALQIMESNLDEPLDVPEIAGLTRLSQRQLERLFRDRLHKSPAQAYLEIRLLRARQMLYRTSNSIEEISVRTGFVSATHFATRYKALFLLSPSADRKRYLGSL